MRSHRLLVSAQPRQFAAQVSHGFVDDSSFVVDDSFPNTIAKTAFNMAHTHLFARAALSACNNQAEVSIALEVSHGQAELVSDVLGLYNKIVGWRRTEPPTSLADHDLPLEDDAGAAVRVGCTGS